MNKQLIEDYVSYEIAKLLKEKGFDEPTRLWYNDKGIISKKYIDPINNHLGKIWFYAAPTHQMALKWLREVHKLHVTIKPYITEEGVMYLFEIYKLEAEKFTLIKTKTGFEKSELANETALKYTLEKLI